MNHREVVRSKAQIEKVSSHVLMVIVGFVIGAIFTHFDSAWPGLIVFVLLVGWFQVLVASAIGFDFRIRQGDSDDPTDSTP